MEFPAEPLSDEEEAELSQLLEQSGSVGLPHARGAFCALACEPSLEEPTDWLPLVLGSEVPDRATLKRVFLLLLRDFAVAAQCLALGRPLLPDADDHAAVTQFCKGFVRVTHASAAWQKDPEALALMLPLAVLAGYLKLESVQQLEPEVALDASSWQLTARRELPQTLVRIFGHFAPLRQPKAAGRGEPTGHAEPGGRRERIGRNEPCPCGSGKKFKKCCGSDA